MPTGYRNSDGKPIHATHGMSRTPIHNRWKTMKQRCTNPNSSRWQYYGAKGVTLCAEWHDFLPYYEGQRAVEEWRWDQRPAEETQARFDRFLNDAVRAS